MNENKGRELTNEQLSQQLEAEDTLYYELLFDNTEWTEIDDVPYFDDEDE